MIELAAELVTRIVVKVVVVDTHRCSDTATETAVLDDSLA